MFGNFFSLCFLAGLSITNPQSPSRPEWSALAHESTAIVVGVVDQVLQVVRPEKMRSLSKQLPSGQVVVELPKPADYVLGRVVRMDVTEVIKKDGKVKAGNKIDVFLSGWAPVEGQPIFLQNQKYLVFLSPMKADTRDFLDSLIYQSDVPSASRLRFNPKSNYVVVEGVNGALHVNPNDPRVIDHVRKVLHAPR